MGIGIPLHDVDGRMMGYRCPFCHNVADFNMDWDSAFCASCNIWLEDECSCGPDSGCQFVGRPLTPKEEVVQ